MRKKENLESEVFQIQVDLTIAGSPPWDFKAFNGTPQGVVKQRFQQASRYSGISQVLESGELVRGMRHYNAPKIPLYKGTVDLADETPVFKTTDGQEYTIELRNGSVFLT